MTTSQKIIRLWCQATDRIPWGAGCIGFAVAGVRRSRDSAVLRKQRSRSFLRSTSPGKERADIQGFEI